MLSNFVCFRIVVVSINLMSKLTLLWVIVVDSIKQILVKVFPFLESEFFTEYTRSDIACNQSGFDRYSSWTTHRVYQVTFTSPACHQNHTGCQYLVQRCFHLFLTVSSTVKWFTWTIQGKCTLFLCNMDVNSQIRVTDTYGRTVACLFAEIVDYRIFHFVCHEFRMTEFIREHYGIYRETTHVVQIVFPCDTLYGLIHFVSSLRSKMFDRF